MKIRCINPWSWYAVVASSDLAAGTVMPTLLNGERLVVWRSKTGRVGVWNDRCPHRGMRLSLGATKGETLICPYHGWEFESDGACSRIPAHPDLSPSRAARARLYPAMEADGYVWACIGEPATAHPSYRLMTGLRLRPVRTMHIQSDAETLAMTLLLHPLGAPIPVDSAQWGDEDGIVTVTSTVFVARLEFPGLIVSTGQRDDGTPFSYAALIQPTCDDTAAVHLSLIGPQQASPAEPLALNRALVRFRGALPALAQSSALDGIRQRLAGMADLHQPATAGA